MNLILYRVYRRESFEINTLDFGMDGIDDALDLCKKHRPVEAYLFTTERPFTDDKTCIVWILEQLFLHTGQRLM